MGLCLESELGQGEHWPRSLEPKPARDLLNAKIGSIPAPSPSERARSNYIEAATEHSTKPDYFAELIERHYPQLPKIELFRRGAPRAGWHSWGNESLWNSAAFAEPPTGEDDGSVIEFVAALQFWALAPAIELPAST